MTDTMFYKPQYRLDYSTYNKFDQRKCFDINNSIHDF
jgi:hypothetical protein